MDTNAVAGERDPDGSSGDKKTSRKSQQLLTIILPVCLAIGTLSIIIGALVYGLRQNKMKKRGNSCVTDTMSVVSKDPSLLTFGSDCYKDEGYACSRLLIKHRISSFFS